MTTILNKVAQRASSISTASATPKPATDSAKPIVPPQLAIANARAAIATAEAAVNAQALKDYTINVTTEGRIHTDAKASRDSLHNDLQSVMKLVVTAKQSVAAAIQSVAVYGGFKGDE